jgi:hypothetical protein
MAETSNFLSKIRKISGEVPGNYSFILPSNFCFGSLIFYSAKWLGRTERFKTFLRQARGKSE